MRRTYLLHCHPVACDAANTRNIRATTGEQSSLKRVSAVTSHTVSSDNNCTYWQWAWFFGGLPGSVIQGRCSVHALHDSWPRAHSRWMRMNLAERPSGRTQSSPGVCLAHLGYNIMEYTLLRVWRVDCVQSSRQFPIEPAMVFDTPQWRIRDSLTDWLTDWLTGWLADWPTDRTI